MSAEKAERFEKIFRQNGLTFKSVDTYGSQVVVRCWSRDSAEKIALVLKKATFTVRGITESYDRNVVNRGLSMVPTCHRIYKVFACA